MIQCTIQILILFSVIFITKVINTKSILRKFLNLFMFLANQFLNVRSNSSQNEAEII
jgi:hypothetical protein